MASSYKSPAHALRDKPRTQLLAAPNQIIGVHYVTETIPRERVPLCRKPVTKSRTGFTLLAVPPHESELVFERADGTRAALTILHDANASLPERTDDVTTYRYPLCVDPFWSLARLSAILARAINYLPGITAYRTPTGLIVACNDADVSHILIGLEYSATNEWEIFSRSSLNQLEELPPLFPVGYRAGDFWHGCPSERITETWIDSADDTHVNLVLTLKTDADRLSGIVDNLGWPEMEGAISLSHPYHDDSPTIVTRLEVLNPEVYRRAPQGTPHPLVPDALLVSESLERQDGISYAIRTYRQVAPQYKQCFFSYQVEYEDAPEEVSSRYPIVTVSLDVNHADLVLPAPLSACPIVGDYANEHGGDYQYQLDFSTLVLTAVPSYTPKDSVSGTLLLRYGRLPSYPKITKERAPLPLNAPIYRVERLVSTDEAEPTVGDSAELHFGALSGAAILKVSRVRQGNGVSQEIIECAATDSDQDDLNWEHTTADIGGTQFDAVARSYIILRTDYNAASPAMGATMANNPTGKFPGTYILAERKQLQIGDNVLDGLFLLERRVYVKRMPLYSEDYDDWSGSTLYSKQTLYYRGEVISYTSGDPPASSSSTIEVLIAERDSPYWGLQSSGLVREGKQLSANWFMVIERDVLPSWFVSEGRAYDTTESYSWPPVLTNVDFMGWERHDGTVWMHPQPIWAQEGYSGPCSASVEESWSRSPHTLDAVAEIPAKSFTFHSPMYTISLPPCLHASDISFECTFGTSDPLWASSGTMARTFHATSPTSWPESWLASDSQQPFRGGYLRQKVTVYPPAVPEAPEPPP